MIADVLNRETDMPRIDRKKWEPIRIEKKDCENARIRNFQCKVD